MKISISIILCINLLLASFSSIAQKAAEKPPPLSYKQGKLQYQPDSLGNRIPDFSYCGYKAGEQSIPDITTGVLIPLTNEDATDRIQAAIDHISKLPVDKNGLRGAVILEAGQYKVKGTLHLHTSGVVIRGAGFGEKGTIILGDGKDRATLIRIEGKEDDNNIMPFHATDIVKEYVPVNAKELRVLNKSLFKVGDLIAINRYGTKEWNAVLGTEHFGGGITSLGWKPNQRNIRWVRTITAINDDRISFDAPLTTAIEPNYAAGSMVIGIYWSGRISNCGVENLQLVSAYDPNNNKDEDHRWMAITIDNATDSWVRQVRFKHFAGSAVAIYENGSRVTVEDCISQQPISEIGGERRNTFFTAGQQTLFQRCYAEYGMHDFATGFCAPGPNAFVQCESVGSYGFSGGLDSWASGVLFDVVNIDGQAISFMNRGQDGQGAGWAIANSVLWNSTAARIDCYKPPTAQNWSFGSWSQFAGDGYWGESNNSIDPRSLYYAQLKERIGNAVNDRVQVMDIETDATSSPTIEQAAALTKIAYAPAKTVLQFISEAPQRTALNKNITLISIPYSSSKGMAISIPGAMQVKNGWLVRGDQLLVGSRMSVPWWSGTAKPYATRNAKMAITRYVPGKTGTGWTDDLDEVTDSMLLNNTIGIEQNYGLWYDRRRDDHERIRRMDGDVWPPFYELPFARSGKESAWDGLSKYDLTKYNHWYWSRLRQFADLADKKGLLLVHQNYFQHNIIEAGAHYADFPWRTANNINNTGFPEPVPYAGDKRIFMAEQFYDTTNALRRELNKKYIRQCLDNFDGNNGVIQFIGEEFTGPLHFVQFWLNTIREWEQQKGRKQLIGLSVTKDVQDAILANPAYASIIDIIDIRYWHYQADGSTYEPKGGQNLAPRQHARVLKPRSSSPQQVYRAVLEYRQRFPDKAVLYSGDGADRNGWAVLMAGGSLPNLRIKDASFLQAASVMKPVADEKQWILANEKTGYIIYSINDGDITADLSKSTGSYDVVWINSRSGVLKNDKAVKAGKSIALKKPAEGNWVAWLKKK